VSRDCKQHSHTNDVEIIQLSRRLWRLFDFNIEKTSKTLPGVCLTLLSVPTLRLRPLITIANSSAIGYYAQLVISCAIQITIWCTDVAAQRSLSESTPRQHRFKI
jgi:hypothetical protein